MSKRLSILVFILIGTGVILSAPVTIRGTVTLADRSPLSGVKITVSETAQIIETGASGEFAITLASPLEKIHLVVEHADYYPVRRTLTLVEAEAELQIVLIPRQTVQESVTVTASRLEIPLRENPASTTVVEAEALQTMPRGIAAEEALQAVPGVKVDNQADGERVHLSIRGQGILSERGIRGIQVLLDGIPLNDPSGFAPDLFDVDWMGVQRVEVLRGPVAFLYGGGSAGGIISITTKEGGKEPIGGDIWTSAGSYGFWKVFGEAGGSTDKLNYHFSASTNMGDGYREHTAFWAKNIYGKLSWQVTPKFRLNTIIAGTGFFNENAEGLNLTWLAQNRRMANPDALTYNEYQKTLRQTIGVTGKLETTEHQTLSFATYFRHTNYKESVPSSVQHRELNSPGAALQYTIRTGEGWLKNTLSVGTDLDWQHIAEYRLPNLGHAEEGVDKLSDQTAWQKRQGLFTMDRLELGPQWTLLLGLRYERIHNELTDLLAANGLDLSGDALFQKTTGRVGITYSLRKNLDLFASWGQGFLPPATEELYANPDAMGGFNQHLISATSRGEEAGVRGFLRDKFFYDVAFFHLSTHNDFERYRITQRPLETFYHNAGDSRRYGLETQFKWYPVEPLSILLAYTYSDFIYTRYDSITYPGDLRGNWLPNSPRHQAYLDLEYQFKNHWFIGLNEEIQSRAFVDATNATWIDGYGLLGCRLAYRWQGVKSRVEVFFTGRNIIGKEYIAFSEPDPDGNSYQPGPTAEFFGGVQIRF